MKLKYLLVILAFAVCLALVVLARQALSGEYKIHHVDFYDTGEDWAGFEFDNLNLSKDKSIFRIISSDNPGILESPSIQANFGFDEILISWNYVADPVQQGGIYIVLSLSPNNTQWHDFGYQIWGDIDSDSVGFASYPNSIRDIGYLDEDIIRLKKHMRYYKFRAVLYPDMARLGILDRISVCYTKTNANIKEFNKHSPPVNDIEPIKLAVPFKSQHWLPDSIAGLTCSPTSLSMVLNYSGFDFPTIMVSEFVYDPHNDIYGNWPYNVQAAYILSKRKSWVGRHNSFGELVDELNNGKPVVISIAVKGDQTLSGAPYNQTDGHLIVVRGFDNAGNVLVNDPAGDNIEEGMVTYDIDELTAVWTGHQGVAYHLWPE
ncbi:MAG: hypothetical protein GY839_19220 [candidate division Zixibacteria bacterium]|nr:hypothetical protein [candidate division Zixibacteria bacterium]